MISTQEKLNRNLLEAVRNNQYEHARSLLTNGADANSLSQKDHILAYAVYNQNLEIIKLLIQYGADPSYNGATSFFPFLYYIAAEDYKLNIAVLF